MEGGDEGGRMEILIKLSLSSCNNRCLLSQQNLDTNLTENEVTPKISLDILLRRTIAKYFFRSQCALRLVTTPSHLPSRTKQRNEKEIEEEFVMELTQTMSIVQFKCNSWS